MTGPGAVEVHVLHFAANCPVCGADFSDPCTTPSGAVRARLHPARERPLTGCVQLELFPADEAP